jgi:opacity protein-like surface antigen
MKKLILSLLVAGSFAAPSIAQAESYYFSLSSGLNLLNDSTLNYEHPAPLGHPPLPSPYTLKYKPGVVVNGALGLKSGALRLEAEAGFHTNKVDKVIDSLLNTDTQARYDISSWTFMANGYYDLDWLNTCVTPYVMGGLGSCRLERNYYPDPADMISSSTQTSVVFAWQVLVLKRPRISPLILVIDILNQLNIKLTRFMASIHGLLAEAKFS